MIMDCDKPGETYMNTAVPYLKKGDLSKSPSEVNYYIKRNYKDVVFTQLSTGIWKETLLVMLQTKTIEELRAAQKIAVSDELLLTLAGLKILAEHFSDDRKSWKLVASKARNALKNILGFTADIDQAMSEINLTFLF